MIRILSRIATQTTERSNSICFIVLKGFLDISKGAKEITVFLESAGKGPTQGRSQASNLSGSVSEVLRSPQIELGWFKQLDLDWSILTEMIPGMNAQIVQLIELMEQWSLSKFYNILPDLNNSSLFLL